MLELDYLVQLLYSLNGKGENRVIVDAAQALHSVFSYSAAFHNMFKLFDLLYWLGY